MDISRKRLRSQEIDGVKQRKMFVNERIVEKNDKNLMQKVYEKTLNLMYSSSKNYHKKSDSNQHENSLGSDDLEEKLDSVEDKLVSTHGCKFCLNEIDSTKASICANCNLSACERCSTCCLYCSVHLCVNCVNLFGCSLDDGSSVSPICEDCKTIID